MSPHARLILVLIIFIPLLGISCVTIQYQKDISDYRAEIAQLQKKISDNPDDAEALRDLGVIYFETAHYEQANRYLKDAYKLQEDDPKIMLYFGMSHEFLDSKRAALEVYRRFHDVPRLSPYRKFIEGRYHRLARALVQEEIRALLKQEQELSKHRLQPQTVAVFPLSYQGKQTDFAVLGKGISEMMTVDLGHVRELTPLERFRIQILIDELRLAQTKYVDPKSAPRVGKLLGASKIIAGSFDVLRAEQLQVETLSMDILKEKYPEGVSQRDALENLFQMEKELVFAVIDEMGIELTQEERQNIQHFPTKNLQAFLAYCRGLEQEDAGRLHLALNSYKKAFELDPEFTLANTKADAVESLIQTGAAREEVRVRLARMEALRESATISSQQLINIRLQNLSNNLGSNYVPGQERRKSTEEAASAGASLGELPLPPDPPPDQ